MGCRPTFVLLVLLPVMASATPAATPLQESVCNDDLFGCDAAHDPALSLIQKEVDLKRKTSLQTDVASCPLPCDLGPGDVDFKDMAQGQLGDCYFLAALVSIVRAQPQLVKDMFVKRDLSTGDHPVYTTQWGINGRKSEVAVNDKVPAKDDELFFAHPKLGNYWPSILEKAWAKIFGTYKRVEGGLQREVFKAVTQAPVLLIDHQCAFWEKKPSWCQWTNYKPSKEEFWQKLLEATEKGWLMGTGTPSNDGDKPCKARQPGGIGVYCGHAYAILKAVHYSDEFPQAVKIYNPHGADKYVGKIPNEDKEDGIFYATLEELMHEFDGTDIGEVADGAVVSDIVLSTKSQGQVALEFEMHGDKPFAVQLEWPNSRFLKGCNGRDLDPEFTVQVAKKDSLKDFKKMPATASGMSNARLQMPGGAGKYAVFVSVDFPKGQWLEEYVVNVYGAETDLKASSEDPMKLALAMAGLCETIEMPGSLGAFHGQDHTKFHMDSSTKVNGMPIFRGAASGGKSGGQTASWYDVMYHSSDGWRIIDSVANAEHGSHYPSLDDEWKKAKCHSSELLEEATPSEGDTPVPAVKEERVMEQAPPKVPMRNGMPVLDVNALLEEDDQSTGCWAAIDRLEHLGSASGSHDEHFPADSSSIAAPGVTCGDSATGVVATCDKFNHWESITDIEKNKKAKKALGEKCSSDCSKKECTPYKHDRGSCLIDTSMCSGGLKVCTSEEGCSSWYTLPMGGRYHFPDSMCDGKWNVRAASFLQMSTPGEQGVLAPVALDE